MKTAGPAELSAGELLRIHPRSCPAVGPIWFQVVVRMRSVLRSCRATLAVEARLGTGVDYISPDLSKHFLAMTHERYRTGLDRRRSSMFSAFFSDEPEFGLGHAYDALSPNGSIPWTVRLPELFEQRYGQPLAASLPGLFFPVEGHELARVRFWELLTDIFLRVVHFTD